MLDATKSKAFCLFFLDIIFSVKISTGLLDFIYKKVVLDKSLFDLDEVVYI